MLVGIITNQSYLTAFSHHHLDCSFQIEHKNKSSQLFKSNVRERKRKMFPSNEHDSYAWLRQFLADNGIIIAILSLAGIFIFSS